MHLGQAHLQRLQGVWETKRQKSQARRVQGEAPALREASAGVLCLSSSLMLAALEGEMRVYIASRTDLGARC